MLLNFQKSIQLKTDASKAELVELYFRHVQPLPQRESNRVKLTSKLKPTSTTHLVDNKTAK